MDRELPPSEYRRGRLLRVVRFLGIGLAVVAGFFILRGAISPSMDRDEIRVASVQRGPMIASIEVSGTVVPRSETVVSAAFGSEIREILAFPGTEVDAGDPILRVEDRPLKVRIADLTEQLALKENERRVRGLELQRTLSESEGREDLLEIDLESRRARLERLEQLSRIGAISKGDLQEARLDVRRTDAELRQLARQIANERETHEAELERIDLEAQILRNQLDEQQRLGDLAIVRAPHAGVVTWVEEETGASVTLGAPLARVADLTTYRVEASASDFYAQQLREGQAARVGVGDIQLDGRVSAILPAVEGGNVRLVIDLDEPGASILRPQLRADVQLVTERAEDTLYLKRGPGAQGHGRTSVLKIEGDVAVRVPVTLGLTNRSDVQVLEGLDENDRIVISSTTDFEHLDRIKLD